MKKRNILHFVPVLVVILILSFTALAQTTEFTYQGNLSDNSQPANGNYDFEFALFDALSAGNQLGSTITVNGVAVSDGGFTVKLDFGAEFPGANRYLEIRVQQSAGAAGKERLAVFTTLTPRQRVTSTPYAVKSLNATNAQTANLAFNAVDATNAERLGGVDAYLYVLTNDPRLTDPRPPTTGSTDYIQNKTTQQTSSDFNISGTGKAGKFDAASQYDIAGIRVLSIAGTSNLFLGNNAGRDNTGNDNTFAGRSAGNLNTTGSYNAYFGANAGLYSNGVSNSFFGSWAGHLNEGGNGNSFFGREAGYNNTGGSRNTFIGRSAGKANTTGTSNSALGYGADFASPDLTFATAIGSNAVVSVSNTIQLGRADGSDSVFVPGAFNVVGAITGNLNGNATTATDAMSLGGVAADQYLTTAAGNSSYVQNTTSLQAGSNFNISGTGSADNFNAGSGFRIGGQTVLSANGTSNIFVGRSAGASNIGTSNTFVGYIAGQNNTSGNGNSFFGRGAGASNTITNDNSFFGFLSGASSTGGVRNSFFGMSAGYGNTTGDLNVFLGGYAGDANTTGSSNTAVGYRAGDSNTTGSTNTFLGAGADAASGNLQNATAIGAGAIVRKSNQIQLGGVGTIVRYLGSAPGPNSYHVCHNVDFELRNCNVSFTDMMNVESLRPGLELIRNLRPVSFRWQQGGMSDVGLVAEEVEKIDPLLATRNNEGQINGINYERVGVFLVNAVKEQQSQIEELKETIKKQRTEIDALKQLVCSQNKDAKICRQKENKQ